MIESIPRANDAASHTCRVHVCLRCGYGISLARTPLPPCPMCRGNTWTPEAASRPRLRREGA